MSQVFPRHGFSPETVKSEVAGFLKQERSAREDAFNVAWPNGPEGVTELALDVQRSFRNLNGFFTSASPALGHVDGELRSMIAEIFHASSEQCVTVTVGGTESNFLAVKTARDKFRQQRSISRETRLNLVIPYTAHPSFDKHAQMMDLDVVRVRVGADWQADVRAMDEAITENTFMLVGSVPSYTHGAIDPISALGALALKHDIWMHVDACVGGFLHPFLKRRNNLPDFDFSVAGVSSISADLHKFGYCLNGISSFTLRDLPDLQYQVFEVDGVWPTGRYFRKTFVGSRSGSVVGAAWAVFKHLGESGFTAIAEKIARACEEMARGLAAIDGLTVNVSPRCGVLSVAVDPSISIATLVSEIQKRGFLVGRAENPPSLHFLLDPVEDERLVSDYIDAVSDAMQAVRLGFASEAADGGHVYGA
jgi:glutamate/tyrosine decarboxylase-like PLP-dependent enzyme